MPSGFFVPPSPPRVQRGGAPSFAFLCSSKQFHRRAAHAVAIGARTSPGVRRSPSAHEMEGARFARRFHSPARSVRGDSHPFDVLLRPSPGRACFIPSYAPGVHPTAAVSHRSFDRLETSSLTDACAPLRHVRRSFERRSSVRGPSPRLSPLPQLPGLLTRTPPLRLLEPHPVSRMTPERRFGVSHRERIGMLSASLPRAFRRVARGEIPAFLRFLMSR
jgi:hypothetical protein